MSFDVLIRKGRLAPTADADLALVDLGVSDEVAANDLYASLIPTTETESP